MEMLVNPQRLRRGDNLSQLLCGKALDRVHASKSSQQLPGGFFSDAWRLQQFTGKFSFRPALSVKTDGKAVGFIPDLLDKV